MINNLIQINSNLLIDKKFLSFLLNSDDAISRMILSSETNSEIIYLKNCVNQPEMISYLTKGKTHINLDELLPEDFDISIYKTQNMKIGRIVSKLFKQEILSANNVNQTDIEHFVNSYKSYFDKNKVEFRIVEGEEIKKWYDQDNYSVVGKGTLWGSCMRHKERLKFLDLYTKNTNIKMLILVHFENGIEKLRGRALLWDEVILNDFYQKIPGDIKIMDRIYTVLDSDVITFKNWAYQNGYIHKLEQNAKSSLYFYDKNEVLRLSFKIPLKKISFRYYPFLDTFSYFCDHGSYLTNDNYNMDWDYELRQANGALERDENSGENE
jgi:hypothetical protein